jgi:hypothetical protein
LVREVWCGSVTVLGAVRVASRQERAMNPVDIAALDALDLLVVVDDESDTLNVRFLTFGVVTPTTFKKIFPRRNL